MTRATVGLIAMVCWLVLGTGAASTRAVELQLKGECQSRGPLVTLGDVADVVANDPRQVETLAAVELFPSPPAGTRRFVRLREIQDLLLARGINLAEHRFSGSAQVTVVGAGAQPREVESPLVPLALVKKAERRLNDVILRYLQQRVSNVEPWTVEAGLDGRQAGIVAAAESLDVAGGTPPWTGTQRFQVTAGGPGGPTPFEVDARVGVAAAVVVAARVLARGTVITSADVQMQPSNENAPPTGSVHSLDEVVGKEVSQMIPAGKAIGPDAIRTPLIVRRGEAVTVYARAAGIRVRTVARARDEGSLGDLIAIESLEDRKPYFARVSGIQEVEVYAQAIRPAPAVPSEAGSAKAEDRKRLARRPNGRADNSSPTVKHPVSASGLRFPNVQ